MSIRSNQSKNASNSSTKFVFWIIGLVAVCLIGFIFLSNNTKEKDNSKKVTIDYSKQPYLGKSSAPVSIIEFGDYKCPSCKNFTETILPVIQKNLIDTGKAKLYFMNDSFIYDDSIRSAKFAESVYAELGNSMFWKFHDLLYKKQPEDPKYEKMDVFDENFLISTLKEVAGDADVEKVVKHFHAKKSDSAWQKDMDLTKKLNVTGTPTLFVNGKLFNGTTFGDLEDMVNQAAKEK